jgi:putative FmdB family regulatory protein
MPIYEFLCEECGSPFEELVTSSAAAGSVECPECGSKQVRKQISLFGTSGGGKSTSTSFSACTTST